MEILINRSNYDYLLEVRKIMWKLYYQKSFRKLLFLASWGIFIMMVSLAMKLNFGGWFWIFTFAFGLSMIFLTVYYIESINKGKKKYFGNISYLINHYNTLGNASEIK